MESGEKFTVELYPEYAPKTVDNFVKLAEDGFFDGLVFHRIVDGFMAQGGGYDISGAKKDAKAIKGEFASNGFTQNTLRHTKGVISMARTDDFDSASSEFFIMLEDWDSLDGGYAAFGKVTEGMEAVEDFQKIERTMNSMGEIATPVNPVIMKKVTVIK
jgi:cyclophilin family peptidyl-prolyl cis-trans isomerase